MTQKARRDQGFILIKNETATLPHREKTGFRSRRRNAKYDLEKIP